jgi:hypothetical protein
VSRPQWAAYGSQVLHNGNCRQCLGAAYPVAGVRQRSGSRQERGRTRV